MRVGSCGRYFWSHLTLSWQGFACEASTGLARHDLTWYPVSGSSLKASWPNNLFETLALEWLFLKITWPQCNN